MLDSTTSMILRIYSVCYPAVCVLSILSLQLDNNTKKKTVNKVDSELCMVWTNIKGLGPEMTIAWCSI